MATFLYRLGRAAYRRAAVVLVAWLIGVAGIVGLGLGLGGTLQDSFAIPGTESQRAIDQLAAVFPQTAGASADVIIRDATGAVLQDRYTDVIDRFVADVGEIDAVEAAISPFDEYATSAVSDDGSTAIIQVSFSGSAEELPAESLDAVRAAAGPLVDAGLDVVFGGSAFETFTIGLSIVEVFGVLFAALVLVVTFGSFLAAGLPLVSALLGLGASLPLVLFAAAFATISTTTPMLGLMIGLAVGIDYALFILMRHRQQLATGMDPEESAATAVATAGGSVVFAGVTVVIALVGLVIVGIPFLGTMGVAAAGSVVAAMLAALTLQPAIMGLLGQRLAPKPGSRTARRALAAQAAMAGDGRAARQPLGERWVRLVLKAPVVAIVGVVAVLGTLSIPAFSLQLALPDGGSEPEGSEVRQAYDLIADEFGPGRNGLLIITVDITQTTEVLEDLDAIAARLAALDGVAAVSKGAPNPTLDTGVIQLIPTTGPTDPATTDLVHRIRDIAPALEEEFTTQLAVTGRTAVTIDVSERLNQALLPFGIVVVGLSIVLLTLVFRSILVPVKAALGYLLSVFAAFGVVVAVFQWGWGAELLHATPGPILSFMPVLLMAILFGLAMDYEVFLVSGMREAYIHGIAGRRLTPAQQNDAARAAVVRGFAGAARVVTAAALIMFFVFAAFVPEGMAVIKVIALGLAVGIAADAFLIRMTLVPAVMALAGRHSWWIPRGLDRILPDVDIEGVGLAAHREAKAWARERWAEGEAITVDGLRIGDDRTLVGPVRFAVPRGGIALVGDYGLPPAERRLVGAVLAGRIPAAGGRAQILGHPLPSESRRVSPQVALSDLDGTLRAEGPVTLGTLLAERSEAASRRRSTRQRLIRRQLDELNHCLRALGRPLRVSSDTVVAGLPQLERALALVAAALAERTPVLLLDGVDAFGQDEDARDFIAGLDLLVPTGVTVVVAVPGLGRHGNGSRVAPALTRRRPAALPASGPSSGSDQPALSEGASR